MKKKLYIGLVLILLLISFENVFAKEAKGVESFTIQTQNKIKTQTNLGQEGIGAYSYYPNPSTFYEFVDQNGKYNILFEIANDSNHMGWITLDDSFQVEREIVIDKTLNLFGNALYYDGYLYIVTGQVDNTSFPSDPTNYPVDYTDAIVLSVTKYDSNGKVVKNLDISGRETSHVTRVIIADGTKNLGNLEYGAQYPFEAGNCDIAINNGVIVVSYAKKMYGGHQMSDLLFVDSNTLEYLSRPTTMDSTNPYYGIRGGSRKWVSHSFDQRVIITSDNQYLFVDQGDAFYRGFAVSKTYNGTYRMNYKEFYPFHFRESDNSGYGYNSTFANLGNIVEVDDGYILVASSEKTLSINYANNRAANEARNIFIQKYQKDFENRTIENLEMFNTEERKSESTREPQDIGKYRLIDAEAEKITAVIDYGVKWLTNYSTEKTILGTRAVKLDNNRVLIFWTEQDMKANGTYFYATGSQRYYYAIINANGDIIQEPLEIEDGNLSNLIHYNLVGNNIYWAQEGTNSNELVIHRLNTNNEEPKVNISLNYSSLKVEKDENVSLKVTTNPITYKLTWESSNPEVATVDESGNIVAKSVGNTIITVTSASGDKATCQIQVVKPSIGHSTSNVKNIFNALRVQMNLMQLTSSKIDINQNGYIDIMDIFCLTYRAFFLNGK